MQPLIHPSPTISRAARPAGTRSEGPAGAGNPERAPTGPVSPMLIAAIFVLALAGRFSLDRVGLSYHGITDPRVPGAVVLLVGALIWQTGRMSRHEVRPMPRVVLLFSALIAFQLVSALWSPFGARVEKVAWDLVALWVLVIATVVFAAGNPRRAARILLVLLLAAAVLYAARSFAEGPQGQGRFSAFGSGPNVFARVIATGIIANVTLAVVYRRKLLLLPVLLLAPAAILSGSRGAVLSLVGAAVAFFLIFVRRHRLRCLGVTLLAGGLTALVAWAAFGDEIAALATGRYSMSGLQQSDYSSRPLLLSYAWSMFTQHPLSGGGLDSFFATYGIEYPHNYLLALAAESGLAAVGLVALIAASWWRGGRPWPTAPKEQVGCAVVAIYVALASSFSGDYYDTRFLWIFAVAAALRPVPVPVRRDRPWESPGPATARALPSGVDRPHSFV